MVPWSLLAMPPPVQASYTWERLRSVRKPGVWGSEDQQLRAQLFQNARGAFILSWTVVRSYWKALRLVGSKSRRIDFEEFLSRPLFAHLSTVSSSGPRDSLAWFLWEEECVWIIGSDRENSFQERVREEPRCAVGIVDLDLERGIVQHVGFRGEARVEPYDVERARRLLTKYLGREERWDQQRFKPLEDPEALFVRFTPDTVVVRNQSYSTIRNP